MQTVTIIHSSFKDHLGSIHIMLKNVAEFQIIPKFYFIVGGIVGSTYHSGLQRERAGDSIPRAGSS
jgi:hypothetical protein